MIVDSIFIWEKGKIAGGLVLAGVRSALAKPDIKLSSVNEASVLIMIIFNALLLLTLITYFLSRKQWTDKINEEAEPEGFGDL